MWSRNIGEVENKPEKLLSIVRILCNDFKSIVVLKIVVYYL